MARIQLSEPERDLLAALCAAAADYQEHGALEVRMTLTLMTATEWKLLDSLIEKLQVIEYPAQTVVKLNW